MSATFNEGLEAAARWHDEQARSYALDVDGLIASDANAARIDKYSALATEHRASARIIRGMEQAA